MLRMFVVASVLGLGVGPAIAKDRDSAPPMSAKESKDGKVGNIKDNEAVRCVEARLEEKTGQKGWKIELKDLAGESRDFVATKGESSAKGTVNVAKSYPNQGALRVYVVPRD